MAVIGGTGGPAQENLTIVLRNGRIEAVTDAATPPPAGADVLQLEGRSVMPGLVGMHNHLMYTASQGRDHLDAAGVRSDGCDPALLSAMMSAEFKDGYDPVKLNASVHGMVGIR